MNNNIICGRFYKAYYLIKKNLATTNYQSLRWVPNPIKPLNNIITSFHFDCYGMFFSWIFRDKLDYIKDELIYLWSLEAINNNYTNKYGDLLWFAYLLATKHQRYILKNTVFDSWNTNNKYRNGTINFSENIFKYSKNINCNCNKIEKGTILLWCNNYTYKKNQKYGHIVICLEEPVYISSKKFILKCGETTINKRCSGLQIKYRLFYHKNSDIYYQKKLVIISKIE
jgi:hypothetical protein